MSERIAIVGAGAMGGAMVRGMLARHAFDAASLSVHDIEPTRVEALAAEHGVAAHTDLLDGVRDARAVVLAVKPQSFESLAVGLRGALNEQTLVLSIMAGVRLATLQEQLQTGRVVRAMPNTPAQVGRGASVWIAGPSVEDTDRTLAERILGSFGVQREVASEVIVDAATAVHASGPAYFYLVAEAWTDAAVAIGIDRPLAEELVRETMAGSARLWEGSESSATELRWAVTSPGGTTAAALRVFEARGLRSMFHDAIEAAFRRAQELG